MNKYRYQLLLIYAIFLYASEKRTQDSHKHQDGLFAEALLYQQVRLEPAPEPVALAPATSVIDHQSTLRWSAAASEADSDDYGCPSECHCNVEAHIADCSNRNLTRVPTGFPAVIRRIRLERNNITELKAYNFKGLRRLQRIDLSNNNLVRVDPMAFAGGLESLNSLLLYSNRLQHLPANLFNELNRLQLLLLNANSLQIVPKQLFQALANLNLLSLYDNNIATLTEGTFDGLKSIKTIHLGKNPLNCDCHMRWLVDYFQTNPVETSEARCESPMRFQGLKLRQLASIRHEMDCQELPVPNKPVTATNYQQQQFEPSSSCPAGCVCNGLTVDCSRGPQAATSSESRSGGGTYELPDIPDDVPVYVARVHINDNRIKRIRQTGLFRRLANSQKLDLGNNKIVDIEDNAINGQFSNGQKPERVVFVLLENQHCEASTVSTVSTLASTTPATSTNVQTKSNRPMNRQQVVQEDPCIMAPKVNEPQFDSACYNGGICRPQSGNSQQHFGANYSCSCLVGFAGPLCEINIDDCVDHQCQNGAMCVDGINSYRCICRDPTTTGEFCEQMNPSNQQQQPTSGSKSIAPIALPIIAASGASLLSSGQSPVLLSGSPTYELSAPASHQQQQQQQQQILARSADFMRLPDDLASNGAPLTTNQQQQQQPQQITKQECQKVTQRKYFDDSNGCQSVRVLKISECLGSCGGQLGPGCCQPAKVKRRRIRMQCSDGASYVKTIDLIKKCACSTENNNNSCPAHNPIAVLTTATATTSNQMPLLKGQKLASNSQNTYYKYLASQQKPTPLPIQQPLQPSWSNHRPVANIYNSTFDDRTTNLDEVVD